MLTASLNCSRNSWSHAASCHSTLNRLVVPWLAKESAASICRSALCYEQNGPGQSVGVADHQEYVTVICVGCADIFHPPFPGTGAHIWTLAGLLSNWYADFSSLNDAFHFLRDASTTTLYWHAPWHSFFFCLKGKNAPGILASRKRGSAFRFPVMLLQEKHMHAFRLSLWMEKT